MLPAERLRDPLLTAPALAHSNDYKADGNDQAHTGRRPATQARGDHAPATTNARYPRSNALTASKRAS